MSSAYLRQALGHSKTSRSPSLCDLKSEDGYDPSDLLQRWENEGEYITSVNCSDKVGNPW